MQITLGPLGLLIAFYLIAMVKSDMVKRSWAFFIGFFGLVLAMAGEFFIIGGAVENPGLRIVCNIFNITGTLVALLSALVACFGGRIAGFDRPKYPQQYQQPQQPGQQPPVI